MSLDLNEEQYKILYAPLKTVSAVEPPTKSLTEYGMEPDEIPPCVFPREPEAQRQVSDYEN